MANHKTGAQRYNDRMGKIFDRARSEGRGLVGNSKVDGVGVNSPAMKAARKAALDSKKDSKDVLKKVHSESSHCQDCGMKISKMERYASGHNHYDD